MIRTSGTGRDGSMTIIPIAVLAFFVVLVVGGPRETLVLAERYLQTFVTWVTKLLS